MEEKYKAYLEMPYEEFYKKTYMASNYDSGSYRYCIRKENDDKESRLSYINYLVKEKGYKL